MAPDMPLCFAGNHMPTEHANNQDQAERIRRKTRRERWALLKEIIRVSEQPMVILAFVWLGLITIELVQGINQPLQDVANIIWVIFGLDFILKLLVAPDKVRFLHKNWLAGVSIFLPAIRIFGLFQAFRIFRLFKVWRATRAINLLRLLSSTRRGLQGLGRTLRRRGFGYVLAISTMVIFVGAAGMYHLESPEVSYGTRGTGLVTQGFLSYGDALWWTSMIMTTMGSEYWPRTAEGRMLGFLLASYAGVVYGYITATLASYFIRLDQRKGRF
jgi:voltage-gated potassium channel